MPTALDAIDIKILEIMQRDASLSTGELAERVGLSQSPCWRRIQRLREEGYIKAVVAVVDHEMLGFKMQIFAQVKMTTLSDEDRAAFGDVEPASVDVDLRAAALRHVDQREVVEGVRLDVHLGAVAHEVHLQAVEFALVHRGADRAAPPFQGMVGEFGAELAVRAGVLVRLKDAAPVEGRQVGGIQCRRAPGIARLHRGVVAVCASGWEFCACPAARRSVNTPGLKPAAGKMQEVDAAGWPGGNKRIGSAADDSYDRGIDARKSEIHVCRTPTVCRP